MKKKEEAHFRQLAVDHAAELYRFAFWRTGEMEAAEDLVQETYLEAWRSIGKLRQPESGRAWKNRFAGNDFGRCMETRFPGLSLFGGGGSTDGRVQGSFGDLRDVDYDTRVTGWFRVSSMPRVVRYRLQIRG